MAAHENEFLVNDSVQMTKFHDNCSEPLIEWTTELNTDKLVKNNDDGADEVVKKSPGPEYELLKENHEQNSDIRSPKSCAPPGVYQVLPSRGRVRRDSSRESVTSDVSRTSCSSIVDGLLFDIYDRWNYHGSRRYSYDSDTTITEYSSTSDAFFGRSDSVHSTYDEKHSLQYRRKHLKTKDVSELRKICSELRHRANQKSARLIRQLKYKDRHLAKSIRNCDIITAILQASSLKRRIDSKIRFSIEPQPGDEAYNQWRDAMKAVARLSLGIPAEFRKKVWLALADNHINNLKIDWQHTLRLAFNERSNPDDNRLGVQIVKDLHRTGCSGFSGTDNEEDRAVLKRVLLAYARWNKKVGYCQGFNVLAALILEVMDKKENDALKVMIYLVDHVLPESYFANNLRALSVDMAVFRDLLRLQLPKLSKHLDKLQLAARDDTTGANYEPPLTNVFTMQWFLTLFATCLSKPTALRVWDSVLLEGSEILLRTAVAIWGKLQNRIMAVQSADEFYTTMGVLTHEMLSCRIIEPDALLKMVYSMAPLPMPQLSELREKYTYNITPFTAAMSTGQRPSRATFYGDEEDFDEDEFVENINCFGGIFPPQASPSRKSPGDMDRSPFGSSFDISKASPGAYGAQPEIIGPLASAYAERMSLDIDQLNNQYKKLKQRQNQAHIILAAASALHYGGTKHAPESKGSEKPKPQAVVAPIQSPIAVNHLFIGRQQMSSCKRNKTIAQAPSIAPFYPGNSSMISPQIQPRVTNDVQVQPQNKMNVDDSDESDFADDVSHSHSAISSASGTSTLKSSRKSDSVSEVSTCGADSDCFESDNEGVSDEARAKLNELILCDVVEADLSQELENENGEEPANSKETGAIPSICVEDESKQSDGEDCVPENGTLDLPRSCTNSNDDLNMAVGKDSVNEEVNSKIQNSTNAEGTKVQSSDESNILLVKAERPKSLFQDSKVSGAGMKKKKAAPVESILLRPIPDMKNGTAAQIGINARSPTRTDLHPTDAETHYVASLTYKSHKIRQQQNDAAVLSNAASSQSNSGGLISPSSSSKARSPKLFNPFPGQHINSRRMQNGVKLGLYSAKNIPKLETGMTLPPAIQEIGKSHINACVHRQYMHEIKQKAKGSKS